MKVMSWNIRGGNSVLKRKGVKEVVCKENPDILVIQETKRREVDRKFIGSIWQSRFKEWAVVPAEGRSGGILVVWDVRRIKVVDCLLGEFSVTIRVEEEGNFWWLSGVYGPNCYRKRVRFWDELAGLWSVCGERWCVGGDFNVTRFLSEKQGSDRFTNSMRIFDELIRDLQLADPPLMNATFTWSNFRENPICCRLDRFLLSQAWVEAFPLGRQEASIRAVSDHCPVILQTCPPKWGPSPFRFDNSWLEKQGFVKRLKEWWVEEIAEGWEGYKFMRKLKILKEKVKNWCRDENESTRVEKCRLFKRIMELDRKEGGPEWSVSLAEERRVIKHRYFCIVESEERSTKIKCKSSWAKEGDANTKLFHRLLNARKARNAISKLENDDGVLVEDEEEISQSIVGFYKNLYQSKEGAFSGVEGLNWNPLSATKAERLERPFEEAEIKKSVFQCEGSKAPGPDGFTLSFFKECWETVKGDIFKVLHEFWSSGIINSLTNETYICLIPKKAKASRIKDFRPISLVSSLYKIISKVLSNRLKLVLEDTISDVQGAFIAGRQILDQVLVANEVVEDYRSSGKEGVVVKIDFEKAYDHVEWGFLDFVLEKKGFGAKWRSWISGCLKSVSFSIMINGRPRGKFRASRGLRQGDPLSPYLFTIAVDVLSRLIDRGVDTALLKPLRVGR